ncbi:hypothetical protein [Nonomuraea salmonea]|uniref:hypothetical protein n=1 Tax=Nonomuraea salmonea TaxID=46181 RepID=UPI0031E61FB3
MEARPGMVGPVHAFDAELVWTWLDGAAVVTLGGERHEVGAGDTMVLPPGRQPADGRRRRARLRLDRDRTGRGQGLQPGRKVGTRRLRPRPPRTQSASCPPVGPVSPVRSARWER